MRLALMLGACLVAHAATSLPVVFERSGTSRTETIELPSMNPDIAYAFIYSIAIPSNSTRVAVDLTQNGATILHKVLHLGDRDFYADFKTPAAGPATLAIRHEGTPVTWRLQVQQWPANAPLKTASSHDWQHATPARLGSTIFASGDETPYIPLKNTPRAAIQQNWLGADWYKISFHEPKPKLVFFQLELMERDNVPVDVSVYTIADGKPKGYYEGEDPVSFPHEVQALQGNKFIARVLREPGDYYVSVRANHPEYKLRTRAYDVPPYSDPKQAVRTALDFILGAGDSWHANTPRRGGVLDRIESVHQETSLCVGCHPTHFSQRAQLYAARNGYAIAQRQQLQFLAERFYNNPRPFYGFEVEGATWSRVISAPANVLSRMSYLMAMLEKEVTRERRDQFHNGIAQYLKLYYRDRDKLPPDETNGNTPLVSAHEVAWYSWGVIRDPRIPTFVAQGEVKNMIDLCYQTLALSEMDAVKYRDQIAKNAERILSLQRPDGQWSMRFAPKDPEVEFQTGHALWALQAAGIPKEHPQVAKALDYLMKRQQPFGGWMDPLQSFENFRTPFRETQMAAIAISSYFPAKEHKTGWDTVQPERLSSDPALVLEQLDGIWDPPSPALLADVKAAAASNNPLIRQAAVEALGRLADPAAMPVIAPLLGDSSKLVRRTAAWAVRQIYSRHTATPSAPLLAALAGSSRAQDGATRVFATHFSALALRSDLARALISTLNSADPLVRMQAARGLWQFWFWTPDDQVRNNIEDAFLAAIARPQHEWVDVNLRRGIYNIADENIRYLYNNWVPLMGRAEDRERAINGRLSIEKRLASKFARVLETGPDFQKRTLLAALTEFPLRRADVYDLKADLTKNLPPVYNRIGNDIEQIAFFGEAGERFARGLAPLLDSPDAEMRRLAGQAALLVRDVKFPDVNRLAGPRGDRTTAVVAKGYHPPVPPPPAPGAPATAARRRPAARLDDNFFRGYVQPILERRGKDGYACVQCHATHTLFDGTLGTVKNVVDTENPENSLLLRKPISSSETEGIAGSQTLAHGGGIRFDKNSPEYITILEWIKGAKE